MSVACENKEEATTFFGHCRTFQMSDVWLGTSLPCVSYDISANLLQVLDRS